VRLVSGYSVTGVQEAAKQLLTLPERPTALACYSDSFADEALRTCADLGLRVPDDVSITGHDDTLGSLTHPALTTMRIPVEVMGRMATECLIDRIENKATSSFQAKAFQPDLIIRASSGAPRT
jgi:LacI family transcriptional regulator